MGGAAGSAAIMALTELVSIVATGSHGFFLAHFSFRQAVFR
jgi:hypothetical protein